MPTCPCVVHNWEIYNERQHLKRHQSFKHQSFKHNSTYDEVVEHPLLKQMDEKPMDLDLMEDSIEVFKIYKLLQRMKNK